MGGVNAARVDAHRVHQLLNKVLALVEHSKAKDHIYQVAGDLIQAIPHRVETLETNLDTVSYALSMMGEDHLKDRLPISFRALVEETVEGAKAFGAPRHLESSASRVAHRYLKRQGY